MLAELASAPGAGGIAAAGLLYAGLSIAVTGPLVAERTIEKSGWVQQCARQVRTAATPPASPELSRLDCATVLGALRGKEGAAHCARYGDVLSLPLGFLDALAARPAEINRRRAAEQGERAESACGCAVATVLESRRYDFALHAGSVRLVTPLAV